MITKIPFDWNDSEQVKIINAYKHDGSFSGYSGYYPCDFQFYGKIIYGPASKGLNNYKLEVSPAGDEPVFWVSGILENKDNHYSSFVKSVKENPQYKF
jgi:hypothetical protein